MDQGQYQRHGMAAYINSLRQSICAVAHCIRDKLHPESWMLRHIFLELSHLEQQLGKLNDSLCGTPEHESGSPCTDASTTDQTEAPPLVLKSCEATINHLAADIVAAVACTDSALNIKLSWYSAAISYSMATAISPKDVLLRLSFLRSEPPADFGSRTGDLFVMRSAEPLNLMQSENDEQVTGEELSLWLAPFERLISCEPGEYYQEKFVSEFRDKTMYGFSRAVLDWPLHAERFWPAIETQALSLFVPSRNYGYINWLLHFARSKWPEIFGWDAPSKNPLIDLTDALCRDQIGPLHVAAAFGLASLCEQLIYSGAPVNEAGILGTPLWCALIGPDILVHRIAGQAWRPSSDRHFTSSSRPAAIGKLLDAGAECGHGLEDTGDELLSISSIAFWVSLKTQDESVLQRIIRSRPVFDFALNSLVEDLGPEMAVSDLAGLISRLLTILLDECIHIGSNSENLTLGGAIDEALSRLQLDLNPVASNGQLPLSDETMNPLVVSAILGDDALALRRCVLDPRFDPNPETSHFGRKETLLHLAIADDFFEAVDILIKAGADLKAKDEGGRVPLMAVESVAMLEKLVLTHGLPTTDVDPDGRTIWHMAAATNDAPLLDWLCSHDPCREVNIDQKTYAGRTPLVEALLSINELADIPFRPDSSEPHAAKLLLRYCKDLFAHDYATPLAHLAVPWGDAALILRLGDLGADFAELDEDGWTPVHHLTMAAPYDFVDLIMELRFDAPWMSYAGLTAAETVAQSTKLVHTSETAERSSHPSCMRELSTRAYNRLLDQDMLRDCEAKGELFWPRFCKNVLMEHPETTHRENQMVRTSIDKALQCVLSKGIMADYERKTGKPGIMCMDGYDIVKPNPAPLVKRSWHVKLFRRYIVKILRNSPKTMKQVFMNTIECHALLIECCMEGELPILRYLCSKGAEFPLEGADYSGLSIIEVAVDNFDRTSLEPLKSLLANTSVEQLNSNQMVILRTILNAHARKRTGKVLIQFFVDKGMSVNPVSEDGESMLAEVIKGGHLRVADWLIGHGAKLEPGRHGFNALIAAAQSDNVEMLSLVGREAEKLGKGGFNWGSLHMPPGLPPRNALHEAAEHSSVKFMREALRQHPELRQHINFITEEGGPIHVAAKRGDARIAAVLVEHGADLALCDHDPLQGYTPLHHACRHTSQALLSLCVQHAPQTISVPDYEGKTPLALATELGNDLALSIFRSHSLLDA